MDGRFRCAAFVLVTAIVWSGIAHATDDSAKGAARELANAAKDDFDAGRFEEAGSKFQRAYKIAKVPTLAVWAARSLVKRGELVAASELYRQAALLAPNDLWVGDAQQQAQSDAEKELGELQPRIPKLRIRVEGAAINDIELTVDGAKTATDLLGIDLPTDPGRRHIVGKRGAEVVERTVELAEGERRETVLRFTAVKPIVAQTPIAAEVPLPPTSPVQHVASPPPVPPAAPVGTAAGVIPEARHDALTAAPGPTIPVRGEALDLSQKPAEQGSTTSGSRWWIWTGVGAVVAGGIVTAVLLSTRSPGRDGTCSSGLTCIVVSK